MINSTDNVQCPQNSNPSAVVQPGQTPQSCCTCNCTNPIDEDTCNTNVDTNNIFIQGICQNKDVFLEGNTWSQNSIIGDINVPDIKPSIETIDSVISTVSILSKRVVQTPAYYGVSNITSVTNYEGNVTTGRKLIIEGTLAFTVSYASVSDDNCVHSFHDEIPFSSFLVLPSTAELTDNYVVTACIEDIIVRRLCPRSISVNVIVTLQGTTSTDSDTSTACDNNCTTNTSVSTCQNNVVTKGVCPTNKITSVFKTLPTTPMQWTEFSLYSSIYINNSMPEISNVLSIISNVQILCQRVVETPISSVPNSEGNSLTGRKLIVQGNLIQKITYVSNTDCNSVHAIRNVTPFTTYIVLDNPNNRLSLESCFNVTACIEDIYSCAFKPNEIFQNTTIFLKAQKIS